MCAIFPTLQEPLHHKWDFLADRRWHIFEVRPGLLASFQGQQREVIPSEIIQGHTLQDVSCLVLLRFGRIKEVQRSGVVRVFKADVRVEENDSSAEGPLTAVIQVAVDAGHLKPLLPLRRSPAARDEAPPN